MSLRRPNGGFAAAAVDAVAHAVFVEQLRAVGQLGVDAGDGGVLRGRGVERVDAFEAVDEVVARVQRASWR
jgi:hypothetical protein